MTFGGDGGDGGGGSHRLQRGFSVIGQGSAIGPQVAPFGRRYETALRGSFYHNADRSVDRTIKLKQTLTAKKIKADCQDDVLVKVGIGEPGAAAPAGAEQWTLAAVFDGHGSDGRAASRFCRRYFPQFLTTGSNKGWRAACRASSPQGVAEGVDFALREACRKAQKHFENRELSECDPELSGTTAAFVLASEGELWAGGVGDSRAILVGRDPRSGGVYAKDLTIDHKPTDPEERQRIEANGGDVFVARDGGSDRVFAKGKRVPGLAMSRSLGDFAAHRVGVTETPDTVHMAIKPEHLFVLLASDGLWDVFSSEEVAQWVTEYREKPLPGVTVSDALTYAAQRRWKKKHEETIVDDISVVLLDLREEPEVQAAARCAERALDEDEEGMGGKYARLMIRGVSLNLNRFRSACATNDEANKESVREGNVAHQRLKRLQSGQDISDSDSDSSDDINSTKSSPQRTVRLAPAVAADANGSGLTTNAGVGDVGDTADSGSAQAAGGLVATLVSLLNCSALMALLGVAPKRQAVAARL